MSRLRRLLSILACGAVLVPAPPVDAAVVRFKASAQVATGMVRVGDVADVSDGNTAELDRLRSVTLLPAPAAGKTVRVDYELVRSRMTAQGINVAPIEFTGKSLVQVSGAEKPNTPLRPERPAVPITDAVRTAAIRRATQAITAYVAKQDAQLSGVNVVVTLSADQAAVLSRSLSQIAVAGGAAPWLGSQQFLLQIREPKGTKNMTVTCQVSRWPQLVHLTRAIRGGEIIPADAVTLAPSDEDSTEQRTYLSEAADVVGMQARRTLRPGEPIAAEDLKRVMLVQRGNPVTVISRVGAITVSMVAKADTDGAVGDTVMVSTLDRKQKLTAWVTGYHEVSVTPPSKPGEPEASAPGGVLQKK